ncbi:MAG: protein kinase [Acidobacteria bacterium]|nr:protein kinase [Acidobacteriota bacterium]
MDQQRYQQVKEIVALLLTADYNERTTRLADLCGSDQELRREVESLLEASDEAGAGFLQDPAYAATIMQSGSTSAPPAALEGQRIGPYRILREIGSGGMGVVYEAVREDEFRKKVAIKVVKPGMNTAQIMDRFYSERRISATLNHPNITMLLDGGATADQRPYFAMEYVDGAPIDVYCREKSLTLRQRLELFRTVCGAVHYAHQNLIVHRDLKPSNILVTTDGVPKLLDFGIAKILDPVGVENDGSGMTAAFPVMTPDYASPEQARNQPVTTATDIYSLGAVLYELLTGKRPHQFTSNTPREIQQVICESETPAPSQVSANRHLAGDIDNIVLMAMHKEPMRRYSSAEELSQDVQRYLSGMPVRARRDTIGYRAGKFVRRHKAGVAAAAVFVSALTGGIVTTTRLATIAAQERDEANMQRQQARSQQQEAFRQRQQADKSKDEAQRRAMEAESQRRTAELQTRRADEEAYRANLTAAHLLIEENEYDAARARLFQSPTGLRGWEWRNLFQRSDNSVTRLFAEADELDSTLGSNTFLSSFAFAKDSGLVWTMYGTVHRWEANFAARPVLSGFPRIAAISRDGSKIVAVPRRGGGKIAVVLDAETGSTLSTLPAHDQAITSVSITPTGNRIATGDASGELRIWNQETNSQQTLGREPGKAIRCISVNGDGTRVVAAFLQEPAVSLYDARSKGKLILPYHKGGCAATAFSPDGKLLATVSHDPKVWVWDVATGRSVRVFSGHTARVNAVTFSPDSQRVATASVDQSVRLWDVMEGNELHTFTGASADVHVQALAISPDGSHVFAGGTSGEILVYKMPLFITPGTERVDISLDDSTLASVGTKRDITLWDRKTHRQIAHWPIGFSGWAVKFTPDGTKVAVGLVDGRIMLWDVRTRSLIRECKGHTGTVRSITFSPDGRQMASAAFDKTIRLWDLASGKEVARQQLPEIVWSIQFSPDGQMLATASGDVFAPHRNGPTLHLWRTSGLSPLRAFRTRPTHHPAATQIAFSNDGSRVAAGEWDPVDPAIWVWDTSTGAALGTLTGHTMGVYAVQFSPNGKLVFSVGADWTFRVWDVDRSELVYKYPVPRCNSYDLQKNKDGSRVYALGYCRGSATTVQVWDSSLHYAPRTIELVDRVQKLDPLRTGQMRRLQAEPNLSTESRAQAMQLLLGHGGHFVTIKFHENVTDLLLRAQQPRAAYDKAMVMAEEAAKRAPHCSVYLTALALGHYRKGNYPEARKTILRAEAIAEPSPDQLLVQAAVEAHLRQPDQARRTLEQSRQLRAAFGPNVHGYASWRTFSTEVETLVASRSYQ